MNRRQFLKALGTTAASLALGSLNGCSDDSLEGKVTKANKELRDFPTQIPGAGKIEKYENPNAKYTLVHIRQKHDNPAGYELPTKEELNSGKIKFKGDGKILQPQEAEKEMLGIYKSINNCQEDIYKIVNFLKKGSKPLEVRLEGVFNTDNINYVNNEMADQFGTQLEFLEETGYFNKNNRNSYQYIPGAAFKLVNEGKIKIAPSESVKYIDDRYNRQGREDSFFNLVDGNSPLAYTIYGGKHDFSDNIQKWNSQNPNKKFSLIEITPESYKE